MARQSSDKLLFEVQLVPPSASNIKTVSQAINKVSNAKQKNTKATQQSLKADQQQKALYDKLKTDIRELETATKQAENANRFGNQTKEKSIKVTQAQLVQLEKLQKEIKQTNLSRKQEAKLLNLVETKRKTMNRSMGRVREGWRGLAKANRHGNRMLMQSGRILQDLPFGFMGISNNIQELVMSWGRASNQGKSFTQVLGSMGKSLMGTGGLIFLLGSALPFAMTVATNGFMGFRNMMGESKAEVDELSEGLKRIVDSVGEVRDIQGKDPLGILDLQSRLESTRHILTQLTHITSKQERINELQSSSENFLRGTRGLVKDQVKQLERAVEEEAKKLGLSVKQVKELKEQTKEIEKQLAKRKAMQDLSPFGAEQQFFSKTVEQGLARLRAGVDLTTNELSQLQGHMQDRISQLMNQVASGEAGMEAVNQINFLRDQIGEVRDAIEKTKPTSEFTEVLPEIKQTHADFYAEIADEEKAYTKVAERLTEQRVEDAKEEAKRIKQLAKKRTSFLEQLAKKRFDARQDVQDDLVALEIATTHEIRDIRERARELGIAGEERVQEAITAIRARAVRKRTRIEREREQDLRDAKFGIWSETASFVKTVNSNILGNSKVVALIQLAIEKGLQIAKVASKTSEKVADLQQTAGLAGAKASMESAKAFSAMASGNVVKAGMHTTASGKFRQAQASATKQAGKTAGIGAKTIALIAGQTLAKGAGILSGGGSGGGSGGSGGGSGGGGVASDKVEQGFNEFDNEDRGRSQSITGAVIGAVKQMKENQEMRPVFQFHGDLDNKAMSIRVEKGRQRRETQATAVKSDFR